jgi:copper chaperone CopZ
MGMREESKRRMKLAIEGMHCPACVARVRKALEKIEGARVDQVEVGSAEVSVDSVLEPLVLDAIHKAGYEPRKSG